MVSKNQDNFFDRSQDLVFGIVIEFLKTKCKNKTGLSEQNLIENNPQCHMLWTSTKH